MKNTKVKINIEFEINTNKYLQYEHALQDFCDTLIDCGVKSNEIVIYEG